MCDTWLGDAHMWGEHAVEGFATSHRTDGAATRAGARTSRSARRAGGQVDRTELSFYCSAQCMVAPDSAMTRAFDPQRSNPPMNDRWASVMAAFRPLTAALNGSTAA